MVKLTDEQQEMITYILERSEAAPDLLNAWELSFTEDLRERYTKYEAAMFLSERQENIVKRIEAKIIETEGGRIQTNDA